MGKFAWMNLLTRPLRTVLALVGLSVPILGVLGLFSVSDGLRNLVGSTLDKIKGVMVQRENTPTPVFSKLPVGLKEKLEAIPGVAAVAPELWGLPPTIEDMSLIPRNMVDFLQKSKEQKIQSLIDATVIQGQDIPAHHHLKSAVYPAALKEGRFLEPADHDQPNIVISRKIAKEHKDSAGKPKQVGDKLKIGPQAFTIVGIYETGSMFLDVIIVMDIDMARTVLGEAKDKVSSFYVEAADSSQIDAVAKRIEDTIDEPRLDARSMTEFAANFGMLMGQLNTFLLMTVSLALLVGVVGIINTMLMSTTERFVEFGVLRTNGWSRGNVLSSGDDRERLPRAAGRGDRLRRGLRPDPGGQPVHRRRLATRLQPDARGLGLGLSVVMGTLGGLYPAWKASRLVPMDAIRLGSH